MEINFIFLAARNFTAFKDMLHNPFYFPQNAVYLIVLSCSVFK